MFNRGGKSDYSVTVIFKRVGDVRPYPDHGYVQKQWAAIAPHQVRLDQLVTTKRTLDLEALRPFLTDAALRTAAKAHLKAHGPHLLRGAAYVEVASP